MGWSWALFLCLSVHEGLAEKAGLSENERLRDKRPAPDSKCFHIQYVDNMIVMGTNREKVHDAYVEASRVLKAAGLQVHEEEFGGGAKVLGWEIPRVGRFRPSRHRAWKIRLAPRELLRRGRCTSHTLEKLVGHCSFLCLGRQGCFSVFGRKYISLFIPTIGTMERDLSGVVFVESLSYLMVYYPLFGCYIVTIPNFLSSTTGSLE